MIKCFYQKFKKKRRAGFTLVEILVYIFVLAIVIAIVIAFLSWTLRVNNKMRAEREVSDGAGRIMSAISYELRHAKGIYFPTSVFDVHPGQLSVETGLDVPDNETKTYKDFYIDSGRLYVKKENSQPQPLHSDRVRIAKLIFRYLQNASTTASVQIDLGVIYNNPTARPELESGLNLISSVTLRPY